MATGPWHAVLRSDELPRPRGSSAEDRDSLAGRATAAMVVPEIKPVSVGGDGILVTRLPSGQVIAFGAHCPHQGTPLRHAALYEGNILCPQHSYVYDAHTGRNLYPAQEARPQALERMKPGALLTYPVVERDGWVWVNEEANPLQPPEAGPAGSAGSEGAGSPAGSGTAGSGTAGVASPDVTGSSPSEGADAGIVDDQPRQLSVSAGERFELVLPTRPRPNHLWWVQVEGEAVEVGGQRFEEREGGPTYLVDAVAVQVGQAQVRCSYAKPWQAHAQDRRTFTVEVVAPA